MKAKQLLISCLFSIGYFLIGLSIGQLLRYWLEKQ